MTIKPGYCACGEPLHYSDPDTQRKCTELVERLGEFIPVWVGGKCYNVQRHFIALHGIKAREMDTYGFEELNHK